MKLPDAWKIKLQYWLPKHQLTVMFGYFASLKAGFLTNFVIKKFIKAYNVDMSIALEERPSAYPTFNHFFSRKLKLDARPIIQDPQALCFPADACVSQFGKIEDGNLIQAKNHNYTLDDLLAGDDQFYDNFQGGQFATLYLAPKDYHRLHMPCDGTLIKMTYVPGELFSVNPLTAKNVPNLFARNERVICYFQTQYGVMAQILVGATIVGSIETCWFGSVTPPRGESIFHWNYATKGDKAIHLKKGDEMGLFKLGSTVINLFERDQIQFDQNLAHNQDTIMGQAYAHKIK